MARRVFYSFHYSNDHWRAAQIRNIGVVEGNRPCSPNDWESVKRGGDRAIESWIKEQLKGRTCAVVLIGSNTAGRKWINFEISQAWNSRKGLLGIHIHNLRDAASNTAPKGANPFDGFTLKNGSLRLSSVVKVYDPSSFTSQMTYNNIAKNLDAWVEESISIRSRYS